mmetsp:Transcript_28469/g.51927  ORF Transcript_28469/g.51927 Transcript_28469/m.51927 type:complete len:228 (+) Transcript_28469:1235-1918(+)
MRTTILLGLFNGALRPRAIHDVSSRLLTSRTKVHGHRCELTVTATLREEHFVLGRDLHDPSRHGQSALEDAAEFGRAVRQRHASESLLFLRGEASRLDGGFDCGGQASGAWGEVEDLGGRTIDGRGERAEERGMVGADGLWPFATMITVEAGFGRAEEIDLVGRWLEDGVHCGCHCSNCRHVDNKLVEDLNVDDLNVVDFYVIKKYTDRIDNSRSPSPSLMRALWVE